MESSGEAAAGVWGSHKQDLGQTKGHCQGDAIDSSNTVRGRASPSQPCGLLGGPWCGRL